MRETDDQNGHAADDELSCHCQGSRLLVLLGPLKKKTDSFDCPLHDSTSGAYLVEDATMYVAQHWALDFYAAQRAKGAHIHMLGYDAPSGAPNNVHRPMVPTQVPSPAETVLLNGKVSTLT